MSRITGVVVALATAAAVLTGSTVGAEPAPARSAEAELPKEIPGGVELAMADGDRLRVWAADNYRAVRSRRYDAATHAWGATSVVLKRKNLYCGEVEGRTANGAVALLAQCDEGGYYEDTAPVSSQALWSPDGVTWSTYTLDGEAYEEPGISPDGQNAVWPMHQRYTTRTAAGYTDHALRADGQEYTVTATITDTAQVSFLYGSSHGCRLVALTRTGDAAPTRQDIAFEGGCSDSGFANVDSDTTWFGDLGEPAQRTVISRADASSPWTVTAIAPAAAPGLGRVGRGRLTTDFFDATGFPLLALGGRHGRDVRAQVYDTATQSWGPSTLAYDTGGTRCRWGDNWVAEPLAVVAVVVRCGSRNIVLTTADAVHWQALPMGRHPLGLSPDGSYVAVPGRSRTSVISPERGVVTLPLGVTGACDVVVPDGPDGAVLLTAAGRHRGWPTVLRHSSPSGWSTLARTNLPTFRGRCRRAEPVSYDLPYRFSVLGARYQGYNVQVLQRGGGWTVRRSRW